MKQNIFVYFLIFTLLLISPISDAYDPIKQATGKPAPTSKEILSGVDSGVQQVGDEISSAGKSAEKAIRTGKVEGELGKLGTYTEAIKKGDISVLYANNREKVKAGYARDCWIPMWGKEVGEVEYFELAGTIVADAFGGSGFVTGGFITAMLYDQVNTLVLELMNISKVIKEQFTKEELRDTFFGILYTAIKERSVKKLRIGELELEAGVASFKVGFLNHHQPYIRYRWAVNALGHQISIKNKCDKPIEIALVYMDLSGKWIPSEGWFLLEPYEQTNLTYAGLPILSNNEVVYYYAQTADGTIKWSGNNDREIDGEMLPMKETKFKERGCGIKYFELPINCEDEFACNTEELKRSTTTTAPMRPDLISDDDIMGDQTSEAIRYPSQRPGTTISDDDIMGDLTSEAIRYPGQQYPGTTSDDALKPATDENQSIVYSSGCYETAGIMFCTEEGHYENKGA